MQDNTTEFWFKKTEPATIWQEASNALSDKLTECFKKNVNFDNSISLNPYTKQAHNFKIYIIENGGKQNDKLIPYLRMNNIGIKGFSSQVLSLDKVIETLDSSKILKAQSTIKKFSNKSFESEMIVIYFQELPYDDKMSCLNAFHNILVSYAVKTGLFDGD